MITPADIRQKALKLWDSGKVLQAALQNEDELLFPWVISFRKPSARQQLDDFPAIRAWMEKLKSQSKAVTGSGYQLDYKVINHRQLGEQRLPAQIVFQCREDLLRFIHKLRDFEQLYASAVASIDCHPPLHEWISSKPRQFIKHHISWQQLVAVCDYFMQHPRPDLYLRELDIRGVDSKFIEQHKSILTELLDWLLPETAINRMESGSRQYGFERRYGLRYPQPLLRLRLLDRALYPLPEISDLSLPLSQLAQWPIPCERVFITENKTNGLSFPDLPGSMVIFGLGYGVETLAELDWLRGKTLIYWGDIDTHGLSILSRLRQSFPKVQAVMMDQATLAQFADLCVVEPEASRCTHALTGLSATEQVLYQCLQQSHQRLEQERLPMGYVLGCLIPKRTL